MHTASAGKQEMVLTFTEEHMLGFVPKPVPVLPVHALHVALFLTVSVLEAALYSILLVHKKIFERHYSLE